MSPILEPALGAIQDWLLFLLAVASAMTLAGLLVTGSVSLVATRGRARRLHEANWVGREEPLGPGIWRVHAEVARLDFVGRTLTWGRSGPATERLAELILRQLVGARHAKRLAPRFARQVLAALPPSGFVLPESQVRDWLPRGLRRPRGYPPRILRPPRVTTRGSTGATRHTKRDHRPDPTQRS